jgi:SAM-dependent methyltransferase
MTDSPDNYRLLATFYDRFIGQAYYERLGILLDQMIAGAAPQSTLVDIGCGTGWLLHRAIEHGLAATGVDISPAMLALAAERCPSAETICASMQAIRGRRWNFLAANNDVFNHLVLAVGLPQTLTHFAELLAPGGVGLFDAVSEFDVRNCWEGCQHQYSDEQDFRCDVSHSVTMGPPTVGTMLRVWSKRAGDAWAIIGEEREEVVGISPDSIMAAAESIGVRVELFDWDLGGSATERTSRIGAWIFG